MKPNPHVRIPHAEIPIPVIGLLGGVASGKTLVAKEFGRLGAEVLDADQAGHEVLRSVRVEAAARARWGDEVFGADGHVDRRRLAGIVFAEPPEGPRERKYLEELTHPEIGRRLAEQAARAGAEGRAAAVLDAPLLLEAGWDKVCDRLVFVDVPREIRLARALARGWSEMEFIAREAVQESVGSKRERALVVIDNSGTAQETRGLVERLWPSLLG